MGALFALALVLALPGGASAARADCFPRDTVTLAHADSGRVYMSSHALEDEAVACLYRTGVKRELTRDYDQPEALGPFAISGRFAAYHGRTCTPGEGGCFHEIYVLDVVSGKYVAEVSNTGDECDYPAISGGGTCGSHFVRRVVLKRNGSVAWLTSSNPRAVWRLDSRGFRRLDLGKGIDVDSLRLTAERTRIGWVSDGRRQTALLR